MDFSWTEEQLKFKKAVIEFAQKELNEGLIATGCVNWRARIGKSAPNWHPGTGYPGEIGRKRHRNHDHDVDQG